MKNKIFSALSYLNLVIISILFILTHTGVCFILYEEVNSGGVIAYLITILLALFIGIRFGKKMLLKFGVVAAILFGFGWYAYNYMTIPYINICPKDLPIRGTDHRCYACDTPYSIDIRNPDINPCPNRKIGKRYCCGSEYDVSALEVKSAVFDTVLCRCVAMPSKPFVILLALSVGIIAFSFYISIWALLFWAIGLCFKKGKKEC